MDQDCPGLRRLEGGSMPRAREKADLLWSCVIKRCETAKQDIAGRSLATNSRRHERYRMRTRASKEAGIADELSQLSHLQYQ